MPILLLLFSLVMARAVQGQSEQDRMSLLSRYEKFAATPGRVTAVNKQYIGKVKTWRVEVRKVTDVKTDSSLLGLSLFFNEQGLRYSFFLDADELPAILDLLRYGQRMVEGSIGDKTNVDVIAANGVHVSCFYHAGLYIKGWYLVCRQVYPGTNIKAYEDSLEIPGKEIEKMIVLIQHAQAALAQL
ncbi:hypothetical protein [Paraflavitalea pollutisoli]|uniref:hypothetical protein n=1 Tax=Paraflavitalea pollutisoli TaxID=3034143 RepID=UPI0023EC10EF|nr:hypothetical protein [Paraflavitalea sp. H1-2-19X]